MSGMSSVRRQRAADVRQSGIADRHQAFVGHLERFLRDCRVSGQFQFGIGYLQKVLGLREQPRLAGTGRDTAQRRYGSLDARNATGQRLDEVDLLPETTLQGLEIRRHGAVVRGEPGDSLLDGGNRLFDRGDRLADLADRRGIGRRGVIDRAEVAGRDCTAGAGVGG
jgi:hypothetical protein